MSTPTALQTLLATLDRLPVSEQKPVLLAAVREVCAQDGVAVSEQTLQVAVANQLSPSPETHDDVRPWTKEHWETLINTEQAQRSLIRGIVRGANRKAGLGALGAICLLGLGHGLGWDHTSGWNLVTIVWFALVSLCSLPVSLAMVVWATVGLPSWLMPDSPWEPVTATPEQKARWQACWRTRELWQAIQRSEVPLLWRDRQQLEAWSA